MSGDCVLFCAFKGGEGSSQHQEQQQVQDDAAAQMETAAEQLAAARRAREAERRMEAITEVEMVLQTYFHNLDNTYNKLQTINEYMDDIEVSFPALNLPCCQSGVNSSSVSSGEGLCTCYCSILCT